MRQFVFSAHGSARPPTPAGLVRRRRILHVWAQAGLPIPDGFCVDAEAYRTQIRALGLEADARGVFSAWKARKLGGMR